MADLPLLTTVGADVARVSWDPDLAAQDWRGAVALVSAAVETALADHARVEALVPAEEGPAHRVATWSGMRREGVRRGVAGDHVVYARLVTDAPVDEPGGFRALLNSFLPRKRAISQMLLRDAAGRVMLCQLTYKRDWDLPGGVVEVGESPQRAVSREVEEELALRIDPGRLLLTDWLPPWGGWDDALCLVYDGGEHAAELTGTIVREVREIRAAEFCSPDQVEERCAAFTARRIRSALAALDEPGGRYTESGRPAP